MFVLNVWQKEWYVFRFGEQDHAARFMRELGGKPMHPKEKGKGKRWGAMEEGDV